jgi:hypothetical protein
VYYLPDLLALDAYWVGLITLIMMVAVTFVYHAALENQANPLSTPLHTVAPWYFLWIQGLLKLGDKTLMGVIVPTILVGMFIFMPYFDVGPIRYYARRRFALSLSMLFVVFIVITSWMGTPAYKVQTSLDQEIFHEMAPSEQVGLVRAIKYEDLAAAYGESYDVDGDWRSTVPRTSGLWLVLEEFEKQIDHAREVSFEQGGLPNAKATLTVSQLQPHLAGVTLRITWDNTLRPDQPLTSELLVPVHEFGYPEGGE